MDVESRCDCVSDPCDRRDGARDEAKEAWVFVADAMGEDLVCRFDYGPEGLGVWLGDSEATDGCDLGLACHVYDSVRREVASIAQELGGHCLDGFGEFAFER
jgi:hypothetical protein